MQFSSRINSVAKDGKESKNYVKEERNIKTSRAAIKEKEEGNEEL